MNDIATVFTAEFLRRIRSRAFVIGLAIGTLGLVAIIKLPTLIGGAVGEHNVIVTGEPRLAATAAVLLKNNYKAAIELPDQAITSEVLKANDTNVAIALSKTPSGLDVKVYTRDPGMSTNAIRRALMPLQLELATQMSPAKVKTVSDFPIAVKPVGSHFTSSDQATAAHGIAFTLIMFLYILILVNSQLVTSSVAEEKTSRIAELLVASVDTSALLAGKILAGAALMLVQFAVWVAVAVFLGGQGADQAVAAGSAGNPQVLSLADALQIITPSVAIAFFLFFILGFFQLSTVMAAFASLINRTEDLGAITGPLVIPVVAAMVIAMIALDSPDSTLSVTTSMIPIVSPFVMFARISVSNVPIWQLALSLIINGVALYLITIFAGKVYRVGMLLYGRAPKLSQVWHVLRS